MGTSDYLSIIIAAVSLGVGAYMTNFPKLGIAFITFGVLVFSYLIYRQYDSPRTLVLPATLIFGVFAGVLRARGHVLAEPVVFGLVVAASTAALLSTLVFFSELRKYESQKSAVILTVDNAKTLVREWLDDSALVMSVRRRDDPQTVFSLDLTLNTRGLTLSQPNNLKQYIVLAATMNVQQVTKQNLESAPKREVRELLRSLRAQLIMLDMEYRRIGPPYSNMLIQMTIPITPDLSKGELIKRISRCDAAIFLANEALTIFD